MSIFYISLQKYISLWNSRTCSLKITQLNQIHTEWQQTITQLLKSSSFSLIILYIEKEKNTKNVFYSNSEILKRKEI